MASEITLASIPHVLDSDEMPFVLGFAADKRPCLEVGGAEFRRGGDRCEIAFKVDPGRLRLVVLAPSDGGCYLVANVGPIFNEWWPTLRRVPDGDASRPFLSAGVKKQPLTVRNDRSPLAVSIVPPGGDIDTTLATVGVEGGLTEQNVTFGYLLGLGVVKAALLTVIEYRTLVNPVPSIDVEVDGGKIPLAEMLQVAEMAAGSIGWEYAPN